MQPTVRNEADRAVAVATEVTRRQGGAPSSSVQRPRSGLDSAARKNLTSLHNAAAQDPAAGVLSPAVETFGQTVAPSRPLLGWLFVEGPYQLVVSY